MKVLIDYAAKLSSIVICVMLCLGFYQSCNKTSNHGPFIPEGEVAIEEEEYIPPAPLITNLPLQHQPQNGLFDKVWERLNGPCHPILPSFKAAFDVPNIRPLVLNDLPAAHAGSFDLAQIADVFDHLQIWKPFDDPAGKDMITPASAVWKTPAGDCDENACTLAAALYCIGAVTRVTFTENEVEGHAFTEVSLGRADRLAVEAYLRARYRLPETERINMREDERGCLYLNLDWTADYPGGPYFIGKQGAVYYPSEDYCETF